MNSAWNIDEFARQSLLCDFYGKLLTDRQREITELYIQENYSLAEIAQELGISRQGAHDAIRSARKSLESYEEKLGLVQRFLRTEDVIRQIDSRIQHLIDLLDKSTPGQIAEQMREIQSVIDRLEE